MLSFTCQVSGQAADATHEERDVTTSIQGTTTKDKVRRRVLRHAKSKMYCVMVVWSFLYLVGCLFSIGEVGEEFCSQFTNQRISSKTKNHAMQRRVACQDLFILNHLSIDTTLHHPSTPISLLSSSPNLLSRLKIPSSYVAPQEQCAAHKVQYIPSPYLFVMMVPTALCCMLGIMLLCASLS